MDNHRGRPLLHHNSPPGGILDMGYHTYHELTIEPDDEELKRQIIDGESSDSEVRNLWVYGEEPSKWYEHDEDMRELSKKWPNVTFHLHGEGEENDDIWTATYVNGLCHHRAAQIIIESFDPDKLE